MFNLFIFRVTYENASALGKIGQLFQGKYIFWWFMFIAIWGLDALIIVYGYYINLTVMPIAPIDLLKTIGLGFGILVWHFLIFHIKNCFNIFGKYLNWRRHISSYMVDPMVWNDIREPLINTN